MQKFLLLGMVCVLPSCAQAPAPRTIPDVLTYQGKPVEPFCLKQLSLLGKTADQLDISKCDVDDIIDHEPADFKENGAYGYSFRRRGGDGEFDESVHYRYAGISDGLPVIVLESSGGGSGYFTELMRLTREGNILRVGEYISGGDRCNGGITDVTIEGGELVYTRNVTPLDIVSLAETQGVSQAASQGLFDAASSCYGKTRWSSDSKLLSLSFTEAYRGDHSQEWLSKFPLQECFNQLIAERDKPQEPMDQLEVDVWVRRFNERCVEAFMQGQNG